MNDITVPEDVRALSRERALKFRNVMKAVFPGQVEPGQIWSTHTQLELRDGRRFGTDDPRLVVILEGTSDLPKSMDQVNAAPISLSIQMASEFDLIVRQGASPFGFAFIVEVWNETPVLKGYLREFLGELSDEALAALRALHAAQLRAEAPPPTLESWWAGIPIMGEEDPRLEFQEVEIRAVEYLAQAATAALELPITELDKKPAPTTLPRRVFRPRLVLGRLSELISGPAVAFAASTEEDRGWYIVSQPEDDTSFVLQLVNGRYPPYPIYAVVQEIASDLEGRMITVTIRTVEGQWQSMPTELRMDAVIQIGEDVVSRLEQVEGTQIEIE